MNNEYVSRFLSLKCSGDVLNAVSRGGKPPKEITESMAVIKHLKKFALEEPMKYAVIDLCAGNALTSVLSVFMLPIKEAIAIDKKKRNGHYEDVKRFEYIEKDIRYASFYPRQTGSKAILISVHPCKAANLVINIYNRFDVFKHLILVPCCNDNYQDVTAWNWLRKAKRVSSYDLWTLHLANMIEDSKISIYTDDQIMSPKNNIIVASRKGE